MAFFIQSTTTGLVLSGSGGSNQSPSFVGSAHKCGTVSTIAHQSCFVSDHTFFCFLSPRFALSLSVCCFGNDCTFSSSFCFLSSCFTCSLSVSNSSLFT